MKKLGLNLNKDNTSVHFIVLLIIVFAGFLIGFFHFTYWQGDFFLFERYAINEYFCADTISFLSLNFLFKIILWIIGIFLIWLFLSVINSRKNNIKLTTSLNRIGVAFLPLLLNIYLIIEYLAIHDYTFISLFIHLISIGLFIAFVSYQMKFRLTSIKLNPRLIRTILATATVIFIVTLCWINLRAYYRNGITFCDSGLFSMYLWNILHGNLLPIKAWFAHHFSPTLLFILPIYAVFPYHQTLLILQPILLGIGVVPVFLLTRYILKNDILSLAFALSYLIYAPLSHVNWTNSYGFHLYPLILICLLFTLYYLYTNNKKWFFIWMFLALGCKPIVSLVIAMLGISIFLGLRKRGLGVFVFLVGVSWFLFVTYVTNPFFARDAQFVSMCRYQSYMGDNIWQVLLFCLMHPVKTLRMFFGYKQIVYVLHLLVPLGMLSLFSPLTLLANIAALFAIISTRGMMKYTVILGHQAVLIPIIFASSILGVSNINRLILKRFRRDKIAIVNTSLVVLLMFLSVSSSYYFGFLPFSRSFHFKKFSKYSQREETLTKIKRIIPQEVSLCAGPRTATHFANRKEIVNMPCSLKNIDYIVFNFEDSWSGSEQLDFYTNTFKNNKDFRVIFFNEHNYVILKKGINNLNEIRKEFVASKEDIGSSVNKICNRDIKLLGFTIMEHKVGSSPFVRVNYFWECMKETNVNYIAAIRINFIGKNKFSLRNDHILGKGVYPTGLWRKGDIVKERLNISVPQSLDKLNFSMHVALVPAEKYKYERKTMFK